MTSDDQREIKRRRTLADYRPQHDADCPVVDLCVCGKRRRDSRHAYYHTFTLEKDAKCLCGLAALLADLSETKRTGGI